MAGRPFYSIVACCSSSGTALSFFNFPIGDVVSDGVYKYIGLQTTINGITFTKDYCYTITFEGASLGLLPAAPTINDFQLVQDCEDIKCECQEVLPCYTLYPCEPGLEVLVSTSTTLEPYIGDFVGVVGYPGCYFVVENALGDCVNGLDIEVNDQVACDCKLRCYSITGNPTSVTYVNESLEVVTTSGSIRVCSFISPVVAGGIDGVVYNFGECVDGECPEVCFKFTNCLTEETLIVTNTTTVLGYYANSNVVTLQGYEGCWFITLSDEPCDCAVAVTVLQSFADCPSCLPTIAYKFTNCNNQSIIRYSLNDFSAYVGKSVQLDCGDCWLVEQIDFIPPSTSVINILFTFDSCTACNRTYYKLTDCTNLSNVTYTYTDLSSIIPPIISCNDCIRVSFTYDGVDYEYEVPKTGIVNGKNEYVFYEVLNLFSPITLNWNESSSVWVIQMNNYETGEVAVYIQSTDNNCPIFNDWVDDGGDFEVENLVTTECTVLLPVIKIKGCDTCFTVEETRLPINAGIVTLIESFDDCEACGAIAPCVCTTVKNYATISQDYNYIDCNGAVQTITVEPGDISNKACMRGFVGDKLCNCIELTINGELYTAVLQPQLINGKPTWTFIYNTYQYNIVYDINEGWQIVSSLFGLVAELNNPMLDCPDGPWTVVKNSVVNVALYLDNGTLVLGGPLVYNPLTDAYEGNITVLTTGLTYLFRFKVNYFTPCNGLWALSYFNTDLDIPVWEDVASFPADCSCLNGTYTDVTPNAFYFEINSFCSIVTEDCSVGYAPFVPSPTDSIEQYGDCINGICPPPTYPKRFIKPGYFTPHCDTEKYEKFACNSAEILYKLVLERRYGITNCCPDTDLGQRWIVKKELADLQGARDQNYICTPVQTCCNSTPTCGCGCNSTLKTCNS